MVAILVSAPQEEPVTRDEAKAHARIDGDAEDARVDALIAAARAEVENRTGRAMMAQGWRIVRDTVPPGGVIRLAPGPVAFVSAVTVYGADGTASVADPDEYQVDTDSVPGRLRLGAGRFWGSRAMNGIEIDMTCGVYDAAEVPAPMKQAVLMLVAYWFEQREAAAVGAVAGPVAHAVSSLLAPYRAPRVA